WVSGPGGNGSSSGRRVSRGPAGASTNQWTGYFWWGPSLYPTQYGSGFFTGDGTPNTNMPVGPPGIGMEHCSISDLQRPAGLSQDYYTGEWWKYFGDDDYYCAAQTKIKLFTGGKAVPARTNLFLFTGWVSELTNKR